MGLMDKIRQDVVRITSNDAEFAVPAVFTAPTNETITINVIHTKHHLGVDTDGNMVNSKKASIAFAESLLIAPYPLIRVAPSFEVDLKDHKIVAPDITGQVRNYIVDQSFPDETIGLIVCILADVES